jgi:gluconate 5-dehydrogenase
MRTSLELFELGGRLALVTGSSQGIGFALARGLGRAGARVVLNGRDPTRLDGAVSTMRAEGIEAEGLAFDVTDSAAVDHAIDTLESQGGAVEILVNNAGIQRRVPLEEVDDATWGEVMRTNLDGVFHVARAVARHMIPRGRGKIVNICSLMSEVGRPTVGPYTAAKGAVKMLTRAMCADWAGHGIQANGIGPGYFATELNRALMEDEKFDTWIRGRTPAGRWGDVDELVGAAIFLAAPASNFVNGQIIYVDGGVLAVL